MFRDSMSGSDGRGLEFDAAPAYDQQDMEFIHAVRTGNEPEASAASCLPAMALLSKIQKSMDSNALGE